MDLGLHEFRDPRTRVWTNK